MEPNQTIADPDLAVLSIEESARNINNRSRAIWWVVGGTATLLISAVVLGLRGKQPLVEIASARDAAQTREVLLNASGYVTPRRRATIAAKITGRVARMLAEEGMHVKTGDVLAVLEDSDARVRLNSANAERNATAAELIDLQVQLTNADRELRRTTALTQSGVSSPQALDQAQTAADSLRAKLTRTQEQVQAAEERVRVAQQDLENCIVRSPFSGIVVSKDAQVGEMVSPISAGGGFTRTGIATVVDMHSLEIEVDVNESYIAKVKPSMPVSTMLDAYPGWEIPARVRTVIPTADRQKATVKVRISFDHLDPRILPDMGVKVTFLGDELEAAPGNESKVLVPQSALRNENDTHFVYLYREGRVERRAVRPSAVRGDDREIIAGLEGGDQVVVSGFESLHDGQRVQIKR